MSPICSYKKEKSFITSQYKESQVPFGEPELPPSFSLLLSPHPYSLHFNPEHTP